jgi:hypothetical protein
MSLRLVCKLKFTQVSNDAFPVEGKSFTLDFVHNITINSGWESLSDSAKIQLPRGSAGLTYIDVKDSSGKTLNWNSADIYKETGSSRPLFMRGDRIEIYLGYWIYNHNTGEEELDLDLVNPQFSGYINKISARVPVEIECEDEMWKLKQIQAPNKLFSGSTYTVKSMITEMLKDHPEYTVTDGGFATSIGDFRVQNESVAQVLERLRNEGAIYSYFRNKELRVTAIVYDPQVIQDNQHVFEFEENIISDSLEYTRKDDLNIAIKAYTQGIESVTGSNADGTNKKKRKRIEVLVGKVEKNGVVSFGEIANDKSFFGDVIKRPFFQAKTKQDLIKQAAATLPKYYYTGFRGNFTTFGKPTMSHGHAVILRSKKIKERQGVFAVKSVITEYGMRGFRQRIQLHQRIDQGFTQSDLNAGVLG